MIIEGSLMCRSDFLVKIDKGLGGIAKAMTILLQKVPNGSRVSEIRFEPGEDEWLFRFVAEVNEKGTVQ